MEQREAEALARALLSGGSGQGTAEALSGLRTYLATPEGRALLARFAAAEGDAVTGAARAALSGNGGELERRLAALLSTPEGAALARRIAGARGQR